MTIVLEGDEQPIVGPVQVDPGETFSFQPSYDCLPATWTIEYPDSTHRIDEPYCESQSTYIFPNGELCYMVLPDKPRVCKEGEIQGVGYRSDRPRSRG